MEEHMRQQFEAIECYIKMQDNLFQQIAKILGISDVALYILIFLYRTNDICTQNDFVERWFFPKQTVSFTVRKLAEQGLVRMTPLTGTKNKKAVILTPKGMSYCESHIAPVVDAEDEAFAELTSEEREMFVSIANKHHVLLKEKINRLL